MIKRSMVYAFSAMLATAPLAMTQPAVAQSYGTDAAVGAAVGALVGSLLFDSNRNQYYYDNGGRHVYVSRTYARQYYSKHDPSFYRSHKGDFARHGDRFSHDWQQSHNHR